MTPDELQTAADDLDRLEELEPRPGRVGLANRLRRHAAFLEDTRSGTYWLCEAYVPTLRDHVPTLRDLDDPCSKRISKHAECGPVIVARPRNEDYAEPPDQEKH